MGVRGFPRKGENASGVDCLGGTVDGMRRPAELPPELRGAIGIHESEAVTPSRLRSSDLWIPARGVRLPRESRSLADLCAAHALTLPAGSAFSGITAARLVGLPLPRWAQSWRGIDVCVPRGT